MALLVTLLGCGGGGDPSPNPNPTPEQAKRALETLQDETKRKQMIDTLRAIAGATPPAQAAPPPAD